MKKAFNVLYIAVFGFSYICWAQGEGSQGLKQQLWTAILKRQPHEVEKLVNRGADINGGGENADAWYRPLHVAAMHGNIEIVNFLLSKEGIDINAPYSQTDLNGRMVTRTLLDDLNDGIYARQMTAAKANRDAQVNRDPRYSEQVRKMIDIAHLLKKRGAKRGSELDRSATNDTLRNHTPASRQRGPSSGPRTH